MAEHLTATPPSIRRRFLKRALWFALLHFIAVLGVSDFIFLLSHVPPKAVNLDGLITAMVMVENVLVCFRKLLLHSWPLENTPGSLGSILSVLNSLGWGVLLAGLQSLWRKLRV